MSAKQLLRHACSTTTIEEEMVMGKVTLLAGASVLQALLLSSQALAASFVLVEPPAGSVDAGVLGLNDQGKVAGSYSTDGADMIGFVGSIDGTYETFDMDGNLTFPRALNNQGRIIGFYINGNDLNQFERTKNGTLTTITKDGNALWGIAQGVNASGEFVGDYRGEPGAVPQRGAYQGKNAAFEADVTLPFATLRAAARGINAKGDIVGWFFAETGGGPQGFVIKDGVTTVLNYPDPSAATFPQGINNKGEISGGWEDPAGNMHGFALDSDLVTWTSFDAPGEEQTQAWQINSLGQIAVTGFSATSSASYIYCPRKGGVCTGKNEKAGKVKTAKGKAGLHAPEPGRKGADPDAAPKKKNKHRQ